MKSKDLIINELDSAIRLLTRLQYSQANLEVRAYAAEAINKIENLIHHLDEDMELSQ